MNTPYDTTASFVAPAWPSREADARRTHLTALGRIYLDAGLPLAAAFEAALADYAGFQAGGFST